jgi:outer membrane protein assembly factor BamE (lipoprotein component of BamABCDE complex)
VSGEVFSVPPVEEENRSKERDRKSNLIFLIETLEERRISMRVVNWMVVFLLVFAFGCATVKEGRKIDPAKVKQLEMGKTKTLEVEQLLGKPSKVEPVGPGEVKYTYEYLEKEPKIFMPDHEQTQRLEIMIKGGIVQTYKLTSQGSDAFLK